MLIMAVSFGTAINAQQDLAAALDNSLAGTTISTDPLDLSFSITNNGALIPTGDTLYFAISIGTTYYTVSGFTENSVSGTILTQDFPNGASLPIAVDPITMQTMYETMGGLTGTVCAIAVGVGSASVNNTFADDATAADNLSCATYTVTSVVGVEENEISEISAYPNPTVSTLNIDLGNNKTEVINIIDMTGRIVNTINVSNNIETIDVSSFENGIYFYQLVTNGIAIKTEKFIVSK